MKVKILIEVEADIPVAHEIDQTLYEYVDSKVHNVLTSSTARVKFTNSKVRSIHKIKEKK